MQAIEKIDNLIRRGEPQEAYDLALATLENGALKKPDIITLKHLSILSLVRAGALDHARLEYQRLGLDSITNHEDILALGGRLLKDEALEATGERRRNLSKKAAEKYAHAYQQTGGYYSAINRATLSLLAGNPNQAKELALEILATLGRNHKDRRGEDGYYLAATRAEAHLLLGDRVKAEEAFATAITLDPDNLSGRATTLHQFGVIMEELSQDKGWLDAYRPPKVAHFAGHLFGVEEPSRAIVAFQSVIDQHLEKENIGFGFGALAAGSDILFAERLLARGGEFHLTLPVPDEVFVKTSVAPFGQGWVERFNACRAQATTKHYATKNLDYMDHSVVSYSNQVAMGLTTLKAKTLETSAVQVLAWDGKGKKTIGTAQCAAFWQKTRQPQIVLPFPEALRSEAPIKPEAKIVCRQIKERRLMAMLFADVRGYGSLTEGQIPNFIQRVLARLSTCCREMDIQPAYQNTWGDGLFLAYEDVAVAAEMAIKLQQIFREIDLKAFDLPEHLTLRIGGHYGPVYEGQDPYMNTGNIFGTEITLAARIEPVTPPGSIFVSEHFAYLLAASHAPHFHFDYVGLTSLKGISPNVPLFNLRVSEKNSRV